MMKKRIPLIVANWKMNKLQQEAKAALTMVRDHLPDPQSVEVGIAAQDIYLVDMLRDTKDSALKVVAQNAHWAESGAFTGETSPSALADIGVDYVMLGHFERRKLFNETNDTVNKKVLMALQQGLHVILDIEEFEQLEPVLAGVTLEQMQRVDLAFEPTYAIGSGKAASSNGAEEVAAQVRSELRELYSDEVAETTRVLYGGSVNTDNVSEFMAQPDIDGVLVGTAALDPEQFLALIELVRLK